MLNIHNEKKRKERLARAKEWRRMYKGKTFGELAKILGITKQAISRIMRP